MWQFVSSLVSSAKNIVSCLLNSQVSRVSSIKKSPLYVYDDDLLLTPPAQHNLIMRDSLTTFSCNLNYIQELWLSQAASGRSLFAFILHVPQLCLRSPQLEHAIGDSDGSECSLCLWYLFTLAYQLAY